MQLWLPDVEVLNLKVFRTLSTLSKLQGLWVSERRNMLYVLATRITFICAMSFDAFPLDEQTCLLQVRRQAVTETLLILTSDIRVRLYRYNTVHTAGKVHGCEVLSI